MIFCEVSLWEMGMGWWKWWDLGIAGGRRNARVMDDKGRLLVDLKNKSGR